jgi:hypothetical protein
MAARHRYRKKDDRTVVAVRLNLETRGFSYNKWGGEQVCKQGDWLIDNDGEVYTVDAVVFARTYRMVSPGTFVKVTPVWAEVATAPGNVKTKEGESHYVAGDYLVYNNEDGTDAYYITRDKFTEMYEPDE